MSAAADNLRHNQRQLDMDGCEVGVSRQAVDEVLAEYDAFCVITDGVKHHIESALSPPTAAEVEAVAKAMFDRLIADSGIAHASGAAPDNICLDGQFDLHDYTRAAIEAFLKMRRGV